MQEGEKEEETNLCVWGNNKYGQLSFLNNDQTYIKVPQMINFKISIRQICCGFEHSIYKSDKGLLYSSGNNSQGQLGLRRQIKRRAGLSVIGISSKVVLCAASSYHNIAYTETGELFTWGSNKCGQLGSGNTKTQFKPINIINSIKKVKYKTFVQVFCGLNNSGFLLDNGSAWLFGSNEFFQLGTKSKQPKVLLPTQSTIPNLSNVALGQDMGLFITKKGELFACGCNTNMKLFHNDQSPVIKKPTKLKIPEPAKSVKASNFCSYQSTNDEVFIWGQFNDQICDFVNPFQMEQSKGAQ